MDWWDVLRGVLDVQVCVERTHAVASNHQRRNNDKSQGNVRKPQRRSPRYASLSNLKAHSHQATPLRWRAKMGMQLILPSQFPSKRSKVPPVNGDGVVWCEQTFRPYSQREWSLTLLPRPRSHLNFDANVDAGAAAWCERCNWNQYIPLKRLTSTC